MVDVIPLLAASGLMRLAYVIPTFQNPTGAIMPEARRRTLARHARELGFTVVEDLTPDYGFAAGSPPPVAAFDDADRVITVGSLSKIAWGGLRIGWIRASGADIDRLVAGKIVADHSTSLITQAIAARVFDRLEEAAEDTRRAADERRAIVCERLAARIPEWTFGVPSGGLSLWVRIAGRGCGRVHAARGELRRDRPGRTPRLARRRVPGPHPDRLRWRAGRSRRGRGAPGRGLGRLRADGSHQPLIGGRQRLTTRR